MTEAEVERFAERRMDALDRLLLAGRLSPEDYETLVAALVVWVTVEQAKGERS